MGRKAALMTLMLLMVFGITCVVFIQQSLRLPHLLQALPYNACQTSVAKETTALILGTPLLHPCLRANITLVSAFFDIGDHKKGGGLRKISQYFTFGSAIAYIHTPFIFYTDSERFADYVTKLRSRLDSKLTRVIRVERDALWPFNLREPIAQLYARKGYPKHQPNTIVPEYSCAQHAKYACLLDVILKRHDVRKTDVYAWLDLGYYRDLKDKKEYCIKLPSNFDPAKPSFNQIFQPNFKQPPKNIYYHNRVWVGGGYFVATRDTMVTLCTEYQRSTEFWLFKHNLSSTDQQNLYASFTEDGRRAVNFGLELQVSPGGHGWFQLGNSCLHLLGNGTSSSNGTLVGASAVPSIL